MIRFRGPWAARLEAEGCETVSAAIDVRSPRDWLAWLPRTRESGRIRFQRQFNWAFPEPPPRCVRVRVIGQHPLQVQLNGLPIDLTMSAGEAAAEISGQLRRVNRLELVYELDQLAADESLLESVALAIDE